MSQSSCLLATSSISQRFGNELFDFVSDFVSDERYQPINMRPDEISRDSFFHLCSQQFLEDYIVDPKIIKRKGKVPENRDKRSPLRLSSHAKKKSESCICSYSYGQRLYIPQIFDKVVILKEQIESFNSSISEDFRYLIFKPASEVSFGIIVNTEFDISEGLELLHLIVVLQSEKDVKNDDIPLGKNQVKFTWSASMSLKNAIFHYNQYIENSECSFDRGESITIIDSDGKTHKAIYLGESRDISGVKVKVLDSGLVISTKKYMCSKQSELFSKPDHIQPFSLLAKRIKTMLKSSLFQKTINYLDYMIQSDSDIEFPTTLTFDTILRKIEGGYYRHPDAIYFELEIYIQNSLSINSVEFNSDMQKAIVSIKKLLKSSLSSRKSTR